MPGPGDLSWGAIQSSMQSQQTTGTQGWAASMVNMGARSASTTNAGINFDGRFNGVKGPQGGLISRIVAEVFNVKGGVDYLAQVNQAGHAELQQRIQQAAQGLGQVNFGGSDFVGNGVGRAVSSFVNSMPTGGIEF